MADLDDFLPQVFRHVPNCPDIVAIGHIRDVARDFCERTMCWKVWATITFTDPEYQTVSNAAGSIVSIERARGPLGDLDPVTPDWLDDKFPDWEETTETADPRYVTQIEPDTLTIYPRSAVNVRMRFVLMPKRTATELPDFLLEHHREIIGDAAAGRILMLPKTDFQDVQLGAALGQQYETRLNDRKVKAVKGQQRAPLRTRHRFV